MVFNIKEIELKDLIGNRYSPESIGLGEGLGNFIYVSAGNRSLNWLSIAQAIYKYEPVEISESESLILLELALTEHNSLSIMAKEGIKNYIEHGKEKNN